MAPKIQHKRSAVAGKAPLPADLEYGEIAVNYEATDPALYIKDSADAVRKIGSKPPTITSDTAPANPKDGDLWYCSADGQTYVFYDSDDAGAAVGTWVQANPQPTPKQATASVAGVVQLADAAAITAGTAGRVVDAAQVKGSYVAKTGDTLAGDIYLNSSKTTSISSSNGSYRGHYLTIVDPRDGRDKAFFTYASSIKSDRATVGSENGVALNIEASGTLGFCVNGGELAYLDPNNFVVKGLSGRVDFTAFNGTLIQSTNGAFHYPLEVDAAGKGRVLQIDSAGAAFNRTGTWGTISDRREKTNIKYLEPSDLESQWDDIKQVKLCRYELLANPGAGMLGVIAQDLQGVSPGLVTELPQTDESGCILKEQEPRLGVKLSVLQIKAVAALQLAMERIEQLETRITTLEARP
jgi:hypothetical protein